MNPERLALYHRAKYCLKNARAVIAVRLLFTAESEQERKSLDIVVRGMIFNEVFF